METGVSISLASEAVGHIGPLEIRNTLLMAWLAMAVLTVLAVAIKLTCTKMVPGRFQMAVEMVVLGMYDLFAGVVHDEKLSRRFFPLVATILVFVVTGNWMGILPGVGSITIEGTHEGHPAAIPLFRSMNADVNMTLAVATLAIFAVQFHGIWAVGAKSYLSKFFVAPWKDPIHTFVGLLEIISEFSRVVSFTFRLFGNIFAGEVLLAVISYLAPYLAPVPFLGMELFVGLIQGFVFALLTTVFLKIAATEQEHGHDDHSHAAPAAA